MKFLVDRFEAVDLRKAAKEHEKMKLKTQEALTKPSQYKPGPSPNTSNSIPPVSASKYAAKGQEACWSYIRGRCSNPECERPHVPGLSFHHHDQCCKFFVLSECKRGDKCNFHHDEQCRHDTWKILQDWKVDPKAVGSEATMIKALQFRPKMST